MTLKNRLKAAFQAFINPQIMQQRLLYKPAPEPNIVLDNQLLAGKNVLITGGGQNIGKHIALEMAKQGANIYFTDLISERCQQVELELSKYPIKYKSFISDVSQPKDNDLLYQYLLENQIKIDILVNNAGISFENLFSKNFDLEDWQKTYNTNVFGAVYLTKLISQMMINNQTQGSIIFLTSIHQSAIFRIIAYSSAKAALAMIVKELAIEFAGKGIRVNAIAPGFTKENDPENPLFFEYAPLHNTAIDPCYIGRAAVYLASDYFSRFTTGTILKIDAGNSLINHRFFTVPPEN